MKMYKKVMKMAKKQVKKMKQQHSGTTARTAGTTARAQDAAREKLKNHAMLQAAVLPLPPAVLPPSPETVVPLEIPPQIPASPKVLLYPQRYLPGVRPVLPPASRIIKNATCSGTTASGQRYYRSLQERYYRHPTAVLPLGPQERGLKPM
jgi:type II secretory pathway pseudopilin PulG